MKFQAGTSPRRLVLFLCGLAQGICLNSECEHSNITLQIHWWGKLLTTSIQGSLLDLYIPPHLEHCNDGPPQPEQLALGE